MIESKIKRLNALTLTDTLTGLPNRRAFDARLALEFSREPRYGRPLAMLMLDVDYFKLYNDHYGHPAGDLALKEVGRVLELSRCRGADFVARIGGEEFAILLPETDVEGAQKIAAGIRMKLQESSIPHAESVVAAHLTVSVGIAIAADETPYDFVNRADLALYTAKHEGRDRAYCGELQAAPPERGLKAVSG
ncbi:MAG: GGDEF domain-containing protein [Oxalobacteraceae bacterium]